MLQPIGLVAATCNQAGAEKAVVGLYTYKFCGVKMYKSNKKAFIAFMVVYIMLSCSFLYSQKQNLDSLTTAKYLEMDIGDYYRKITKKKSILLPADTIYLNSRGPFFTPLVLPGYAMVTGFLGEFTSNISFYTLRNDTAKISTISTTDLYSQYKQFINIINSNIWTNSNKFNLLGDYRYYIFPVNDFGLGSKTTLADATKVDYEHLRIYEVVLGKISENIFIGAGYNLDYYWGIKETKNAPTDTTDLDRYGLTTTSTSSGLTVNIQFDNRLNSNNPDNGTYANLQVRDNSKLIGSNSNWQSAVLDIRHYFELSKESHNVIALWSYDWLTLNGKPPYFDLPAAGNDAYNNTSRGYVEDRFRGLNFLYFEAEYRFRILNNGFLGGTVFTNVSSFSEYPSNKFTAIDPGEGVGLRVKMNKKSNVNLCVDYGIGIGGSRGFVFNMSEVF
jgi:hypothetical protein